MKNKIRKKDIAIIGISINFPDAKNSGIFWKNLSKGTEKIENFTKRRELYIKNYLEFSKRNFRKDEYGRANSIDDIDCFDYEFFNFPPREAKLTDPHQRKFLETVWSAIEDAGYIGKRIQGTNTGVYVGFESDYDSYGRMVNEIDTEAINYASPSNIFPIIASRISYILDLKGPNMLVDTACSSSLVAMHYACQDLQSGKCNLAIAGGVKVYVLTTGLGSKTEIESSLNQTRTFDDTSDGTSWGEGVAALILKPLAEAQNDKDNIYAIIKGGAVNQDGKSNNITAPNPDSQAEVIEKAWQDAEVDPESISYIEAHGTGTPTGDPIEIQGITKAFKKYTSKKQFCAIGSVKSNIGHLATASGLAGVVKVVLALQNKKIPPTLHFNRPNRKIDFINSPVFVCDKLMNWEKGKYPRRSGISAFGFSGTNCHVILEEAPKKEKLKVSTYQDIFTVSAKKKEVFDDYIKNYLDFFDKNKKIDFNDLCFTANTGREHYLYRLAVLAGSLNELRLKIKKYKEKKFVDGLWLTGDDEQNNNNKIKNRLSEIAERYVNNKNINWEDIYLGKFRQKISLPTYPFQKLICWFDAKENQKKETASQKKVALPLLDMILADSFDQVVYSTYLNPQKDWILKEHIIGGNILLVGTAYVEMVLEAFLNKFELKKMNMKNVKLLAPMVFSENETREVQVLIRDREEKYSFYIASRNNSSLKWQKHFEGEINFLPADYEAKENTKKVLNSFKNKSKIIDKIQDDANFYYGPRWQSVKKIYLQKDKFLIDIEMDEQYKNETLNFAFHPALFDRVIVSDIMKFIYKKYNLYLPVSYDSINIIGRMPSSFYSYIIKKNNDDSVLESDIVLFDKAGNIFAEIKGYKLVKTNLSKIKIESVKSTNIFYNTVWRPEEGEEYKNKNKIKKALVFFDGDKQAGDIVKDLKADRIIKIKIGLNFEKLDENNFSLGDSIDDYYKLIEEIGENFDTVLHLATLSEGRQINSVQLLKDDQERGVLSLFRLTRAIQEKKLRQKIEIFLFSNNIQEVSGLEKELNPQFAPLFGLGKVVPMEEANINCRSIDVDRETKTEKIISEINSNFQTYKVAYRNNKRYVEFLDEEDLKQLPDNGLKLKSNGSYVIAGGLGGVGLEIARFLSTKQKLNIVLLGRTSLPDREQWGALIKAKDKISARIKTILEIEKNGSKVLYVKCNIADEKELKSTFEYLLLKYQKINGILHCAGLAGDGFIRRKSEADFKQFFDAKLIGTWLIDHLTKDLKLDFFINFSSIISTLGTPGQSDYTAVSAYQDAFSAYRSKKGRPTMTINWGGWAEAGMALDKGLNNVVVISKFISNQEATEAFGKVIGKRTNNIIINKFGYNQNVHEMQQMSIVFSEKVKPLIINSFIRDDAKLNANVRLIGRKSGEYNQIEKRIGGAWSRILGYDELDINKSFFEMGGDSLSAIKSLHVINREYDLNLLVNDLFENSTIKLLAEKIITSQISEKKQKEKSLLASDASDRSAGGLPFTPIGDYLSDLRAKQIKENFIAVSTRVIDASLLNKALKNLANYNKTPFYFYSINENGSLSAKEKDNKIMDSDMANYSRFDQRELELKELALKKQLQSRPSQGISFCIFLSGNYVKLLFSRNHKIINDHNFTQSLLYFQKFYNIVLAAISLDGQKSVDNIYTPFRSYPEYYDCLHSTFLEKIRLQTGKFLYKSLFPALDFFTLPSYFITPQNFRRENNIDTRRLLGYPRNEHLKNLKVNYYNQKENALKEYNARIIKDEKLVLAGLNYFIPTNPMYRNENFLKLIEKKHIIRQINLMISQEKYEDNPVVHSINFNYFGRISQDDFAGFWINSMVPDSLEKFGKVTPKYSFWLYNFLDLKNYPEHKPEMLFQALRANLSEYRKNKIIKGSKEDIFTKGFFGQQVFSIFRDDIERNIKNVKGAINDLVIIDYAKRLVFPFLHLHDLLLDLLPTNNQFYEDTQMLNKIIKTIDQSASSLVQILFKKGIPYQFKANILPPQNILKVKILTKRQKDDYLEILKKLENDQEKLLISLERKLALKKC